MNESRRSIKIVCLGDSLTFGYGVPDSETWVALASAATGLELVNRGINGDTTGGMLARLLPELAAENPQAVLIIGGSNDILVSRTGRNARANLSAMAHQALSRGVTPLVGTPIPIDVPRARADWAATADLPEAQELLADYVTWIRGFGSAFGVTVVDFWDLFAARLAAGRPAPYSDGIHPNPQGHRLMSGKLVEVLDALKL